MKKSVLLKGPAIALAVVFAMALTSAEMFIGQVDDIYNIGDELKVNVTISAKTSATSFFSAVLSCADGEIEMYRSAESIQQGKQKIIFISVKFDRVIIGNLSGACNILTRFSGEEDRSSSFEISSAIKAQANIEKSVYAPDEKVRVTGSATKKNGKQVTGYVEAGIKELGIESSGAVTKGIFNLNFSIPSHAPANNYFVNTRVYERDYNGEITNYGESDTAIKIKQVAGKIEIAFNELSALPGEEFFYTVILADQSGEPMAEEVPVSVIGPSKESFEKRLVKSGQKYGVALQRNATPGNWRIEAQLEALKAERAWEVEEVKNASFIMSNGTLTVVNTGNVPYNKSIEVTIGNKTEMAEVDLGVGQSKKFRIYAPDGSYDLKVYSDNATTELGNTFLTGDSIAIKDYEGSGRGTSLIIWLIVAFLGCTVFLYGRKVIKKAYIGRMPKSEPYFSGKLKKSAPVIESPKAISRPLQSPGFYRRSGRKEECGIVAISLRNRQELEQDSQASSLLARTLKEARDAKAAIKQDDKGYLFIFSSAKTGKPDNALHSIKTAASLERMLIEYNKKHALNVDFGIGVHLGEMIVENSQGTHTFIAIGNSIVTAKKASERAQMETLISAPAHRKTSGIVKTEQLSGENLWKVKNIIDREEHKEFLDRFMGSNKF